MPLAERSKNATSSARLCRRPGLCVAEALLQPDGNSSFRDGFSSVTKSDQTFTSPSEALASARVSATLLQVLLGSDHATDNQVTVA